MSASTSRPHFGTGHRLYTVARDRCVAAHGMPSHRPCGACWEDVVRADERVAFTFDLPPIHDETAGSDIDEVAVARACAGEHPLPTLTDAERTVALARLLACGVAIDVIEARIGISATTRLRIGRLLAAAALTS